MALLIMVDAATAIQKQTLSFFLLQVQILDKRGKIGFFNLGKANGQEGGKTKFQTKGHGLEFLFALTNIYYLQ